MPSAAKMEQSRSGVCQQTSDDLCGEASEDPVGHLWQGNQKLFVQLLDDLDDLTCSTPSAHRRRKAREIFSDWLFSPDACSREVADLRRSNQFRRSYVEPSRRRVSEDLSKSDIRRRSFCEERRSNFLHCLSEHTEVRRRLTGTYFVKVCLPL